MIALAWIPATLIAALAQTARNAMQSSLTRLIGTAGATQVRFLYGWPFALLFLALVLAATGESLPAMTPRAFAFTLLGAVAQIGATALMLSVMRERSFSVVTAIIKTEPVLVALFGLALLGDALTGWKALAILVATSGVVLTSMKPGAGIGVAGARPVLLGIVAGAGFGIAAVAFRGAILGLPSGSFILRATTALAWSLCLQTGLLGAYLALFDRAALTSSLRVWRVSLGAGFLGALASQFWFLGFSLTSAANVRTLALVEVPLAALVSRRLFVEGVSRREVAGMALIVAGVGLLLTGA